MSFFDLKIISLICKSFVSIKKGTTHEFRENSICPVDGLCHHIQVSKMRRSIQRQSQGNQLFLPSRSHSPHFQMLKKKKPCTTALQLSALANICIILYPMFAAFISGNIRTFAMPFTELNGQLMLATSGIPEHENVQLTFASHTFYWVCHRSFSAATSANHSPPNI